MEIKRALAMFRLDGRDLSVDRLNRAFRELVKKYHPDKVRDHPEWAHERMAEINLAYERLMDWATASRASVVEETPSPQPEPEFEAEDLTHRSTRPMPARMAEVFYPIFNRFLDGLGLYYQYGLDRPAHRVEGVRRFRFREALRTTGSARDQLESLARDAAHPVIVAAARFARLAVADMDLGEPVFLGGTPRQKHLDYRLNTARRSLDGAVKSIVFPELVPEHRRSALASGLYSCYPEFVVYLSMFNSGERQKAGILQTARYDAFMDLLELKGEGFLKM